MHNVVALGHAYDCCFLDGSPQARSPARGPFVGREFKANAKPPAVSAPNGLPWVCVAFCFIK